MKELRVSYIVNSVFTSRTYILSMDGCPEVWLVDCGDVPEVMERLKMLHGSDFIVKGVLLTHAHYDHIYGLPRLKELFPDVSVYTNEIGRKMLGSDKLNMSKYHEDPVVFDSVNVMVCGDGSRIVLFDGAEAKVHYTPGHNPSCLSYEVGDFLFTGDSYIPGIKVVTNLPGGEKALAQESMDKILKLAVGKVVCSGHEMGREEL